MDDTTIYLLDPTLHRAGQIEDFTSLEARLRFNAVGTWLLTLDTGSPAAAALGPGWGVELVTGAGTGAETPIMSGILDRRTRSSTVSESGSKETVEVSGVDDLVHLADRLAMPQPATAAPPYSTSAYDVRTGQCSTILGEYVDVNAGPGAVPDRHVTGLTVATDPALGGTVTGRGRYQQLLTLLTSLAVQGGGLGFQVIRSNGTRVFEVYQPRDLTGTARFSRELGNLGDFTLVTAAPAASYIVAAGGGQGTARTVREGQDPGAREMWGRRIEQFRDRRDTTVTGELDATIIAELQAAAGERGLTVTPIDTAGLTYGVDYGLGDRVTVIVDGQPVSERITEVAITVTTDGVNVVPSVGAVSRNTVDRIFRRLALASRRIRDLERS